MRKNLLCGFGCAALGALVFALLCLGLAELQVRQATKDASAQLSRVLDGDPNSGTSLGRMPLRERLLYEVDNKFDRLDSHVDTLYAKLSGDVRFLATKTDARLDSLQTATFAQLTALRTDGLKIANEQLTETNKHVGVLASAYADVPKTVGARLDPFTDCSKNKLCLQGQAADVLLALRTTSRDVSGMTFEVNKVMPSIASSVKSTANSGAGIAKDFHTMTTDFVKPRTKWQQFKSWLETGGKIIARFL